MNKIFCNLCFSKVFPDKLKSLTLKWRNEGSPNPEEIISVDLKVCDVCFEKYKNNIWMPPE